MWQFVPSDALGICLAANGNIKIAIREQKGTPTTLPKISEKMLLNKTKRHDFPESDFAIQTDLDFLQHSASFTPYTTSHANERYENEMVKIFNYYLSKPDQLPDKIAGAILDLITSETQEHGVVNSSYFLKEDRLGKQLIEATKDPTVWNTYKSFIEKVALAPYATFLSDTLDLDPIYEKKHQDAIQLWRKVKVEEIEGEPTEIELKTKLDYASYVRALSMLSIDNINDLLSSKEYTYFRSCLNKVGNKKEQDTLIHSYYEYRRKIEALILSRNLGIDLSEAALKIKTKNLRRRGQKDLIVGLSISVVDWVATFGLVGPLYTIINAWKTMSASEGVGADQENLEERVTNIQLEEQLDEQRFKMEKLERKEQLGQVQSAKSVVSVQGQRKREVIRDTLVDIRTK